MDKRKEKMLALLAKGVSYRVIGELFGISKSRVHAICGKTPFKIGYGGMTKSELLKSIK